MKIFYVTICIFFFLARNARELFSFSLLILKKNFEKKNKINQ